MYQGFGIRLWYALASAALYSLISGPASAEGGFDIAPPPSWIEPIEYDPDGVAPAIAQGKEGTRYLLVDRQVDVATESRYAHYAILIENLNGAQDQGRQTFDYDPNHHTLRFHRFDIIRDGRRINRLDITRFKTLQRETDLHRNLYDESQTVLLILDDLRTGDILDYAFTRTGANPALDGRFIETFSMQYGVPVDRIRCSIRAPLDRSFSIKSLNQPPEPIVLTKSGSRKWVWERLGAAPIIWNDETPASFYPYTEVRISEYKTWGEVVEWALPLYDQAGNQRLELADHPALPGAYRDPTTPVSEAARAAIEFVQDDIRYFGIETGPNSVQPHPAPQVLQQRFGDCKDKTVLLIALLRNLGVEAHPLLVNSYGGKQLYDSPPSAYAFDHVVALIELPNQAPIVVDATYSYQRGPLSERYQPSYEAGLLIKPGETELRKLPPAAPNSYAAAIVERYRLPSIDGPLSLQVESLYTGGYADYMRSYFQSNRLDLITKNYAEFYGKYYEGISADDPVASADDPLRNQFSVNERYSITHPWYYDDREKKRTLSLYSPTFKEGLVFPSTKRRSMPLALPYPMTFDKTIEIELPRRWKIDADHQTIDNAFFRFEREVSSVSDGQRVRVRYRFQSKADEVPAEDIDLYLTAANQANNLLTYGIVDDLSIPDLAKEATANAPLLLYSIAFALIAALLAYPALATRLAASPPANYSDGTRILITLAFISGATMAYMMFAYETLNYLKASGSPTAAETTLFLASLFQRIAVGVWLGRSALMHGRNPSLVDVGRRILAWNAAFLLLWLIVRGGIQAGQLGFHTWLWIEAIGALAIWLVAKLARPEAASARAAADSA